MSDLISRQAAIDCVTVGARATTIRGRIAELPSAEPSDDYERGWEDGRKALQEEIWEDERDRLD